MVSEEQTGVRHDIIKMEVLDFFSDIHICRWFHGALYHTVYNAGAPVRSYVARLDVHYSTAFGRSSFWGRKILGVVHIGWARRAQQYSFLVSDSDSGSAVHLPVPGKKMLLLHLLVLCVCLII